MKPCANLVRQLAFSLCGLGGLACSSAAYAQSVTPTATASWSAANLPGAAVYQDKFISGGSLVPDIAKGGEQISDDQGLARWLQVDGVVSALSSKDGGSSNDVEENGFVAK